jgi:hypothetical protein
MHTKRLRKVPQLQRMPDLLVVNEEDETVRLVEVITKTRKPPKDVDIDKHKLEDLKKFWRNSILAVVIPNSEHVFYAEKVTRLNITDPEFVNFDMSENPITKRFPKVKSFPKVFHELQDLCKKLFSEV